MCLSARPAAGLAGALESPTQTAGPAGGLATARPLAPSCLPQGRVGSRPTGGPGKSAPPPTAVEGTWTDRSAGGPALTQETGLGEPKRQVIAE